MIKLKANVYNYSCNTLTVEELKEILLSYCDNDSRRKMFITKDRSYYGSVGAIMFTIEGSPTKAIAVLKRSSFNENNGTLYILPNKKYQVDIIDLQKYKNGVEV